MKNSSVITPPRRARTEPNRHDRELASLMEAGRAIGAARDLPALMAVVCEHVASAFAADRATLYLHDAERCELWTSHAADPNEWPRDTRIPDDHGPCGRVFQTHQPHCIVDATRESGLARRPCEHDGFLMHSLLFAPVMQTPRRCVGVLEVMDRREGYFSQDDARLLEAIAVQVALCLDTIRLVRAQQRQFETFVSAISAALDARDPLTTIHSINVANYAMGIGEILGLPSDEIAWLRMAGLLHDIGKIGVSDAVLTKAGRLSPEEFDEMKRHAAYSRNILSRIAFTDELEELDVLAPAHHERLDGSGYPEALRHDQLPRKARILAVADVYDALTQTRHYRRGMTMHEAFKELDAMTPHQLDRHCVAALKAFLGCGPWPIK
ncbi:MAG TPA: HD domain-containing phosphohydrolase [Phycisphaerae bacterium]|nr:HD domain-containing phosphohydrolase [Phycisphaerae bacterium]